MERLKVGGGRGRLLSPGNEVGVSMRVSSGNQRSLSLDMGLGELVPASGMGVFPSLERVVVPPLGRSWERVCSALG